MDYGWSVELPHRFIRRHLRLWSEAEISALPAMCQRTLMSCLCSADVISYLNPFWDG